MFQIILYILLSIVLVFILVNALMPRNYYIAINYEMRASREAIFPHILDFRKWKNWMAWAIHDKHTKWEYGESTDIVGGWYTWDGPIIGAGRMDILEVEPLQYIKHSLQFLRPKSAPCEASITLADSKDGKVLVSWTMEGSMPFFSRFFIPILKKMLSKDYKKGLMILEQQALFPEEGHKIVLDEVKTEEPIYFAYLESRLNVMNTKALQAHFDKAFKIRDTLNTAHIGHGIGVYSNYNFFNRTMKIRAGYKLSELPASSTDYETAQTKGGLYQKLTLRGEYSLIPEAWGIISSHPKLIGMKVDLSREAYEIYTDTAGQIPVTEIYMPVKGKKSAKLSRN